MTPREHRLRRRQIATFARDVHVDLVSGTETPLVTVLFPTFNQEAWVGESLASVLGQVGVPCHIMICDDASTDKTFEIVYRMAVTYAAEPAPLHTVTLRRNSVTLVRQNIHMMSRSARCDIVIQAHGDDISLPHRMATIEMAYRDPAVLFVTSDMALIDESGAAMENLEPAPGRAEIYCDTVLGRPYWLIGAVESWRRSFLNQWPALDQDYAPASHDRIIPLRAALQGGAICLTEKLVIRLVRGLDRDLPTFDMTSLEASRHGWALISTMFYGLAREEIGLARERGYITKQQASQLDEICARQLRDFGAQLRRYQGLLMAEGKRLVWR
jgi:glycosyltransferase involved in cell wall biosynthesis